MKTADKGLNLQALAIEEAQAEIREEIKKSYLSGASQSVVLSRIKKIIQKAVSIIIIPSLYADTRTSLMRFANMQYGMLIRSLGNNGVLIAALVALSGEEAVPRAFSRAKEVVLENYSVRLETQAKGIPLQQYSKEYIERKVAPVFERLSKQKALDPYDESGRNTLRNLAEMEVRYKAHTDEIDGFKKRGVRLVVTSVHVDCSDRCYEWQGRVYSLDGSSGVTADGKKFVPLEKATDVYTKPTKSGRIYKNGLLGYNCRHKLYEYNPSMIIPSVSKDVQQKESGINSRQRELEKRVRNYKSLALGCKEIDRNKYLHYRRLAIKANKQYQAFSRANGRAYYPTRVKVI